MIELVSVFLNGEHGPILNDFDLQLVGFWSQLERFSTPNTVDLTANQPTNQPAN